MTDQLSLYNGALRLCEERKLASIAENREPARLLTDVWDADAIKYCLELGLWLFASRSERLEFTSSVQPDFGYRYAFSKPADYIRTMGLCSDEYFNVPLNQAQDEGPFWFADVTPIYVRYVSNDNAYGRDMSRWPQSFVRLVEAYLAKQVVGRITKSKERVAFVNAEFDRLLLDAKSKDAMNDTTKFMPMGSWSASRMGSSNSRRSMWNGQTL